MGIQLVGNMICNLLVLVGLTYLLSQAEAARPTLRRAYKGAVFGVATGLIAGLLMLASFDTSNGVLADLRSIVLVFAGALGGPLAAVIATAMAGAVRLAIGHVNVELLGLSMGAYLVLGVGAWAVGAGNSLRSIVALGVVLTLVRPAIVVLANRLGWFGAAETQAFLTETFPYTALFYLSGMFVMGWLLRFEESRAGLKTENRELSLRDARYRAIFETSSVAMMWTEKDGRIILANQRMADFVGYSRDELQNLRYEDLLAPEDREDYFRVRAEADTTGLPPRDRERRYLRKDGGFVWGLRSTALVQPSGEDPLRKFVIIQDITEQKEGEQKIRLQAQFLESVSEAVIATDMQGKIIFWNRFAAQLCGWAAKEAIGRSIDDVLPAISEHLDPTEIRVKAGETWSGELTFERRDGSRVRVHAASSPVRDETGATFATVTVAADITDRTSSQLALVEEQRTLAILNRTAAKLNEDLDLRALMQAVTDAGVELTGAEFGALWSGHRRAVGDASFSLSGIDSEAFEALPVPKDPAQLESLLADGSGVRSEDVTEDPAFAAQSALAVDDLRFPVRSYLATPLVARSGEMIGALIFGHSQPSMFNPRTERIIEGLASHAAIAIEKASLFKAAEQEIETRKAAEESLSKSKARFRDFAEVGSDLMWETDDRFRITAIVGDSRAVFGMPETELIGRTAWEIAKADVRSPDWRQHVLDHETRQPYRNFEYPIADRNGATRWISTNGRPYFDEKGVFLGFRGASTNIAGRKHAEAKLAASARQQQSAAVLSQLALQGVPREDLYQVAVDLVSQTLGVELVGLLELSTDKRVLRLRAGAGWPAQSVNIRAVPVDYCPPLARGINSDVPVHFSRRNFNLIPGLQNDKGSGVALPIGEKAQRIGVIVVCSDGFRAFSETDINFLRAISFVLAADAEQRKQAATLRLRDRALDSIGEGIMITDAAEFDNPITYVNPAFERLTGYSKEEAIGRNARFLQGEETDASLVHTIHGAVETESMFRGSILNYRKNGEPFWNNLTISPIPAEDGATSNFVGVLSDETERVQLASQLRQAQKMEALGHLTGGVAHDFNNLLAVILGNSEILHEEITDPDLKATAELVMTTAEKGADLTQRLLAFGRRQALHPEALDLGATVGSLSDMLNRTLGTHITLEISSNADKPAYIDRSLFESAILNLVLNARDAMPNGGVLNIDTTLVDAADGLIKSMPSGQYVRVAVKDTGVGMAQDVLERAFDPFFTTKGVGKGSGMGLSMVYGFAKQSGGHVTIDSQVGQGTTVSLYLPVARDAQAAKRVEVHETRPTEGGCERILVVEDEPHLRKFVISQLANLGYSVIEAEAGAPALEILQSEEKIDLLFTDLLMPGGMSGFDLAQRAREFAPNLKVLLTTGYAAEADALLADVKDPILKKPYKKQQLAEALRSVLEKAA